MEDAQHLQFVFDASAKRYSLIHDMEPQFPIRFVPSESGIRNVAIGQGFDISAVRNEERKLNAEDTLLGRVVNTCPSNFGTTDFKWRYMLHRIGRCHRASEKQKP